MTRRKNEKSRRKEDRRKHPGFRKDDHHGFGKLVKLVEDLRMQARTRASANRMMKVEPSDPEKFLEWKAANVIESQHLREYIRFREQEARDTKKYGLK